MTPEQDAESRVEFNIMLCVRVEFNIMLCVRNKRTLKPGSKPSDKPYTSLSKKKMIY